MCALVFDTGTSRGVHLSPDVEVLARAAVLCSWVGSVTLTVPGVKMSDSLPIQGVKAGRGGGGG